MVAKLVRRNDGCAKQARTEYSKFAEPLEYCGKETLRKDKRQSCTPPGESTGNDGGEDDDREIHHPACSGSQTNKSLVSGGLDYRIILSGALQR
jgi:hypothetical protein